MELIEIIKNQEKINKERNKRAKIIENSCNINIEKALKTGMENIQELSKEQIIRKFVDTLDIVFLGTSKYRSKK